MGMGLITGWGWGGGGGGGAASEAMLKGGGQKTFWDSVNAGA